MPERPALPCAESEHDPLALYDELRNVLKAAWFDPNSRAVQLVNEAQWDMNVLRAEREDAIASATMALRTALRELLGSYVALSHYARHSEPSIAPMEWDGPVLAKGLLDA